MKCILISFFNSYNIGDVVISDMLYKLLSKKYKVDKFSYTGGPLVLNDTNNVSVNNSNIKGKLKLIISNALYRIHLGVIIKKYSYINLKKIYLEEFESKICKNDILVIGGGNMIFDINKYSRSGFKFLKFIELAKKYNKKVFAISIGIGPFATQKQELNAVNVMAEHYDMPVIYSTHPRRAKFIEQRGFKFHPNVRSLKPFGFSDYDNL